MPCTFRLSCAAFFFLLLSGEQQIQSFQQTTRTTICHQPSLHPPSTPKFTQRKPRRNSNIFTRPDRVRIAQYSTNNSMLSASSSSISDKVNQVGPSMLGLFLATIALYFLGSESGDLTPATSAKNVIDTALPQSATEVVAVAVAEGIGGIIGVSSTSIVAYLLKSSKYYKAAASASTSLATEAVAGADFFLTRAAAVPLLISAGLDPVVASLFSVFIASVPYELVKDQARRSQRRQSENVLLNELLQEEQDRKKRGNLFVLARAGSGIGKSRSPQRQVADVSALKPAVPSVGVDVPELVTDVIKWLEYDVLKNNYSGEFAGSGLAMSGSMESFTFGFLAALSSQLYLDAFYLNTDLGPKEKKEETRKRNGVELISLYASSCLSTATLFAAYEGAKEPVRLGILRLLSGGIEACVGSTDFNACVFTYEFDNPVIDDVASFQGEVRALVVAIASLAAELQTELVRMIDEMLRMMQM